MEKYLKYEDVMKILDRYLELNSDRNKMILKSILELRIYEEDLKK